VDPTSKLSPALAPLWRALHSRMSSGRPVTKVRLGPLDREQQEAIADLLGLARLPGARPSVSVAALDRTLRDALGLGVRDVVARLAGPIGDRASERRQQDTERSRLWAWLAAHPVVTAQPALADWVASIRRTGVVGGSIDRTREDLTRALLVLAELPTSGSPLPVFAELILGDPHALDEDQRCSGLVLKALAAIYQIPPPRDNHQRRVLWRQAGIADDELSSTVLMAGFRPDVDGLASRILNLCSEAGQAASLTLQHLRQDPAAPGDPGEVWVVENPSVLALALARFGPRCPPLICTSGWPSSAGILLLTRLSDSGTVLNYHGDFDGEGLRIAAHVVARTGALPWRMASIDYLAAVADGPPVGRVTPVPWDSELADHLLRTGRTLSEERTAPFLLENLAARFDLPRGVRTAGGQGVSAQTVDGSA
jgi:uncharacterized protein (TIGR02679 family)